MMITSKTNEELWDFVLGQLKPELKDETFNLWLKPLKAVKNEEGQFVLRVPNRFFSDWIKAHYQTRIENLLSEFLGSQIKLSFETQADESMLPVPTQYKPSTDIKLTSSSSTKTNAFADEIKIEAKYAFDNFVVGPSNRFAEAAAEAVARDPGRTYNPLFIYGGVGLGKTHLLHSIARHILKNQPNARITYVPSERFINEFIDAIRFERMKEFRSKYRGLDCLLIDDIQFLMGKESSQEEFFYTFNTLYDSRKQIVICSDRPPKETLVGDRLISRFEWGVIADIQPPDLETRIAILRKKTAESGQQAPDDVILFVASHIKTNIRELEGSITRIMAYANLTGFPLTVDTARTVLKDILTGPDHAAPVTIEQVQKVVARHFNLDLRDMKSKRRTDAIAFPRQVAMYLCRTLTELSTIEIGAGFGGKDHTTVMHGCSKIKNKLSGDPYFVALVNKITQDIREESLLITP
ncbi:MAG: Chromosomal replication initiator protein DnaA [Elusimicrobia bacterium]|nr:Chromosomal replication initiator protein DnaA [Elusimicrobiota bacterium]